MAAQEPPEAPLMSEVQERAAAVEDVSVAADVDPHPDDGDEHGDRVDLVRTGLVRIHLGGKRYRLRRPFLGELKKVRLAMQDANDEIVDASDEALALARVLTAEAKDANTDEMSPEAWIAWRRDARRRSNEASRALTDMTEDRRLEWWEQVWDLLTVDGRPGEWPSWVVDPTLHSALVTHWRSTPLGRG